MTEPVSELPKGKALIGMVVRADVVHGAEHVNGKLCTVVAVWAGSDTSYTCRFDDVPHTLIVSRSNMSPV